MTLAVNIAQGASNNVTFRNKIINGNMVIDQRNAGASVTPADGAYTLDRWQYQASQASKFTVQQNAASVTPPTGFSNYLGATVAASVSVGSGDYFGLLQRIEGFNFADMAWGTASASPITVSFWVRSSLTGTFGGSLRNSAQNRSYPFTYIISSANTSAIVAPPAEAAVVCLVPSSKIIPLAETLPLTPMPPATVIAPVVLEVDTVVFVTLIEVNVGAVLRTTAPVPVEVVTPVPPRATVNVPEVIAAVSIAIAVLVINETPPYHPEMDEPVIAPKAQHGYLEGDSPELLGKEVWFIIL